MSEKNSSIKRVILEPTNRCNLNCSICLRQSWNGNIGIMKEEVFSKFLAALEGIDPLPEIFLGGYGEPLSHPEILEMIRQLSDRGCQTTLITNGTLLTQDITQSLIGSGLGKLWVSVDSFHQQSIHSTNPTHTGSLMQIGEILGNGKLEKFDLGISLILTRGNQVELLADIDQALQLGINSIFITNLEAYSPEELEQIPYTLTHLRRPEAWRTAYTDLVDRIDNISTQNPGISIKGVLNHHRDKCPFAERGDLVLRWDGEISPCLPLLYDHTTHIGSWEHTQYLYSFGNIVNRSLAVIKGDPDFIQLRERLLKDEFSPCLGCRDCWLSDNNLQDCMGFEHPACGGCLWAAGLISCP
jgi:MoaA/NifB/PqqE/SkfB family radical SAM enzyme